jgi:hypothetical protein
MQKLWDGYVDIKATLQPSIDSWQVGDKLGIQPELMLLFSEFGKTGIAFFNNYITRAVYCQLAGSLLVTVSYALAATAYFHILNGQLRSSQTSSLGRYGSSGSLSSARSDSRLVNLRFGYNGMVAEAVGVALAAALTSAVSIWLVADTRHVLTDDNLNSVLFDVSFLAWSLFGFPANVLIAWRLHKKGEQGTQDTTHGAADCFGPLSLAQGIKVCPALSRA